MLFHLPCPRGLFLELLLQKEEGKDLLVLCFKFLQSQQKGHCGARSLRTRSSFFLGQGSPLFLASACRQTACQAGLLPQPYLSCAWQV